MFANEKLATATSPISMLAGARIMPRSSSSVSDVDILTTRIVIPARSRIAARSWGSGSDWQTGRRAHAPRVHATVSMRINASVQLYMVSPVQDDRVPFSVGAMPHSIPESRSTQPKAGNKRLAMEPGDLNVPVTVGDRLETVGWSAGSSGWILRCYPRVA